MLRMPAGDRVLLQVLLTRHQCYRTEELSRRSKYLFNTLSLGALVFRGIDHSAHNRDRCHRRIDLQPITLALDSTISSFSSFL
jgi:hypothetical protein